MLCTHPHVDHGLRESTSAFRNGDGCGTDVSIDIRKGEEMEESITKSVEIQLLEVSNNEKSPSVEYDPSSDTKTEPTSRMAETSKVRVARGELVSKVMASATSSS